MGFHDPGRRGHAGTRRHGAGGQGAVRRDLECTVLDHLTSEHAGRPAGLESLRRPPDRVQPDRAHTGAGAAADGQGARYRGDRLVAARWRYVDRQVQAKHRETQGYALCPRGVERGPLRQRQEFHHCRRSGKSGGRDRSHTRSGRHQLDPPTDRQGRHHSHHRGPQALSAPGQPGRTRLRVERRAARPPRCGQRHSTRLSV